MMSSLMLQHSHVRWKEWIPLVTQQQRLRNLVQIIGYNIGINKEGESRKGKDVYFYYTLHLTTMCAPFYTSEKIAKEHPKWSEINYSIIDPSYGSVTGMVIRVWEHYQDTDNVVTVWGLYFSGLSYIGPKIVSEQISSFSKNTLVFYMHGGYFTSSEYMSGDRLTLALITTLSLNHNDVRKSYTLDTLLRLHNMQRTVKEMNEESMLLHNKILAGDFVEDKSQIRESSAFLRKLLKQSKPVKVSHEEILTIKKNIEMKRFQVQLLREQKLYKMNNIRQKTDYRNKLRESNQEESKELANRYQKFYKDSNSLKLWKKSLLERKETLFAVKYNCSRRQKKLISELGYIYPIEVINDKYHICNVHLPDSDDFNGQDDTSLTVALGFTADLVQLISFIINIPLRYPILNFGSRSKIVDHTLDDLPDRERECPLFPRGRERRQFDYGVYLLNRNIAQLRCYCEIRTSELKVTLKNLETLLKMHLTQKTMPIVTEDLTKFTTMTRYSIMYNDIPYSFNYRQGSTSESNLDKWEDKKKNITNSSHGSASVSREDAQSSDSVEHDLELQSYLDKMHLTKEALLRSKANENKILLEERNIEDNYVVKKF